MCWWASPIRKASRSLPRRLGTPIERCLAVEDSEPGLAAARTAVATTAALRGLAADITLTDLGRLADHLDAAEP
jgi:beta-phosphoglucomutase-like phosphatase (HAD superfamily)